MQSAVAHIARAGRRIAGDVLNLVLPVTCPVCERPVAGAGGLCDGCWAGLDIIAEPVCDAYGTPLVFDEGKGAVSARAISSPPAWDRARGAVMFNDRSQHLVHALKYRDRHEVLDAMAGMMVHAGHDIISGAEVIAPVPLHRWRLWSRRCNQAALLAGGVGVATGIPVHTGLVGRVRNTRSQVGLGEDQRSRNVKGAFSVPDAQVSNIMGRNILLVDDVLTSGATANECARMLKLAGAVHVDVLVFALVSHTG
ncbi:MAG: ComF family protein [Pseudomonadota bacterium]